jgi:hypothetical protein
MKKLMMILTVLACSNVFAEGDKENHGSKPCLEVKKACESAGFKKGDHKDGKGLYKDCMQKLANGETVAGVSVTPEQVSACKVKHEERKEHKKDKK